MIGVILLKIFLSQTSIIRYDFDDFIEISEEVISEGT